MTGIPSGNPKTLEACLLILPIIVPGLTAVGNFSELIVKFLNINHFLSVKVLVPSPREFELFVMFN